MELTIAGLGQKAIKGSDGKFYGVSKPLQLTDFEKGRTYDVEIKQNGNFLNIVAKKETAVSSPDVVPQKPQSVSVTPSKGRDFDAEARGKTRCQMFSAALQSPVLQQYFYTKEMNLEEILETVRTVANAGVSYTFGDK